MPVAGLAALHAHTSSLSSANPRCSGGAGRTDMRDRSGRGRTGCCSGSPRASETTQRLLGGYSATTAQRRLSSGVRGSGDPAARVVQTRGFNGTGVRIKSNLRQRYRCGYFYFTSYERINFPSNFRCLLSTKLFENSA